MVSNKRAEGRHPRFVLFRGHPEVFNSNLGMDRRKIMLTVAPFVELEKLRHRWGWFLALGIVLILLGIAALAYVPAATLGSVFALGWLMIFSGIVEGIYAFHVRGWRGVSLHLLGAVLGVVLGLIVVTHPVAGALAFTLVIAAFLTVIGLFRTISAIQMRYRSWGWVVFDGIITLVLGLALSVSWPVSAIWFLGFALGIELILRGWTTIMFALVVRAAVTEPVPVRQWPESPAA